MNIIKDYKKLISFSSVVLICFAALYYFVAVRPYETTDNAFLHSDMTVISAKVSGYVETIPVQDNQFVQENDLLLTLDDTDYQARLEEATAAVRRAEAALDALQHKISLQERRIIQAKATLDGTLADLSFASREYDRSKNLKEKNVVSQRRLEQTQTEYAKAKAEEKRTQAALHAAQDELSTFLAQQQEARAALGQATALQKVALDAEENTKITASFSGTIGNKGVQKGQYIRPGQSMMYLVDTQNPYVIANFKETQLTHMNPGQPATIKIDAYPHLTLAGAIESIAPATGALFSVLPPENATGNFTKVVQRVPVKIRLDQCKEHCDLLRAGLSVNVSVKTR